MSKQKPLVDWRALSKLEQKITADDSSGVMDRWNYGREVLKAKDGRKQLPDGMLADLVKASGTKVDKNGVEKPKISEREIRYRVRLAEVYATDQQVGKIIADLGTWTEIINAGFPEAIVDDPLFDVENLEVSAPDEWEQLSLLPGFKPIVKIQGRGREVPLAQVTVPEAIAYRDKFRQMHEGFAKTLDQIEATVEAILDGWDGNPETKAVDAYQHSNST